MNALVKQGNALPTVSYLAPPVSVHRKGEMIYKALVKRGMVGAGGVEPSVLFRVSKPPENRCADDRFCRSRPTVGAEVKCSPGVQLSVLL